MSQRLWTFECCKWLAAWINWYRVVKS